MMLLDNTQSPPSALEVFECAEQVYAHRLIACASTASDSRGLLPLPAVLLSRLESFVARPEVRRALHVGGAAGPGRGAGAGGEVGRGSTSEKICLKRSRN